MSVIPLPQQYNGHRHDALLSDSVVIGGSDKQGDVNCDDEVTAMDALFMLRDIAGIPPAECLNLAGDVNCDGDKTAVDALDIPLIRGRAARQTERTLPERRHAGVGRAGG